MLCHGAHRERKFWSVPINLRALGGELVVDSVSCSFVWLVCFVVSMAGTTKHTNHTKEHESGVPATYQSNFSASLRLGGESTFISK